MMCLKDVVCVGIVEGVEDIVVSLVGSTKKRRRRGEREEEEIEVLI